MHAWELSKQILREMYARKLRSVLALFGITWGTISVVLLLALGQGFYAISKQNMVNMADSTLILYPGSSSLPFRGLKIGRKINISATEVMQLTQVISGVKLISPIMPINQARISWRHHFHRKTVTGVSQDYARLRTFFAVPGGRFINQNDINAKRRVVFLGDHFKQRFFGETNPVGEKILVNGITFEVIGVRQLKTENQNIYDRDQTNLFIPYTTFTSLWGDKNVDTILLLPQSAALAITVKNNLNQYLSHRLQYSPSDKNAMHIIDLAEGMNFFKTFFLGIEIFLGFCGLMDI